MKIRTACYIKCCLVTCSQPPCSTRGDGRWRSSWVSPPSSRPPPRPPPRPGRRCQSAGGHTREDQSPWTPRAGLGCDCGWGEMLCKHKEDQKCPLKNANCLLSSWRKVLILLNLSLLIVPGHVVGDPRKQQMFILLEIESSDLYLSRYFDLVYTQALEWWW